MDSKDRKDNMLKINKATYGGEDCTKLIQSKIKYSLINTYFPLLLKSASKTGLVDSSPENLKALNDETEKVNRQYGASGNTFDDLPKFEFKGKNYSKLLINQFLFLFCFRTKIGSN